MKRVPVLAVLLLSLGACGAKAPDLSGSWKLDVEKSNWGKNVRKPVGVSLEIRHDEPVLKYSGTVVDAQGESRGFYFEGAIDGREYPARETFADGKIVFERKPGNVIASTFLSADGTVTETAETSVSAGGKTLTRRIRLKRPGSDLSWTERYDRR
jgi:hypothetical protein